MHRSTIRAADHSPLDFVCRAIATWGRDVVATRSNVDRTARDLRVVASECLQYLSRRNTEHAHATKIERHLHFARRLGPTLCRLHTVHACEPVFKSFGDIIQL